jgi:predicted Na+-dependent transporter
VDRGNLLAKLFMAVAVPAGLGLFLRARYATIADRLSAVMHPASMALLCVFVLQVIVVNFEAMLAVQSAALLGALVYIALAFGAAYLLGGPRKENRRALVIMTVVRNVPISMTAALQVFPHEPGVLVMITTMAILTLVFAVSAVVLFRMAPSSRHRASDR